MPKPENVNPEKFKVDRILYDRNDFSISYGTWTPTGNKVIGMRWNNGDDGSGYPKTFGHPQWFVISDDLVRGILIGLLSHSGLTNGEHRNIVEVLGKVGIAK